MNVMSEASVELPTLRRLWNGAVALCFASFLIAMTAATVADPDLWGHVRFGRDILQNGAVAQSDAYSYVTKDHRWINHEWLAEVIFAGAWNLGGAPVLIALKTAIFLITFWLAYCHLRYMHVAPLGAAILILILFEVLMPFLAALRPYAFTALLLTMLLHLISRAESGHYRWLWLVPPTMALWANLHGGFLAGLGLLFLWGAAHLLIRREGFFEIIPPIVLSFAATLINPYHLDLLLFLIKTATVRRPEITDWQPMQWNSLLGILDLCLLFIALLSLSASRRRRDCVLIFLFVVTAIMPFGAVRHILLSAIATIMLLGEHMADAIERLSMRTDRNIRIRAWFLIIPALLSISIIVWRFDSFHRITLPEDFYPVRAVQLLKQSGVHGNLAIHFPWGEYAIWHLGPAVKVAVDGRRETVYPDDVYRKFLNFQYGLGDWDALITDYPTDMVLIQKDAATYRLMSSRGDWRRAYEDSISAIFVRNQKDFEELRQALLRMTFHPEVRSFP